MVYGSAPLVFCGVLAALPAAVFAAEDGKSVISSGQRRPDGVVVHAVESEYQRGPTSIYVLLPKEMPPDERYRVLYVLPVEAADGVRWGSALAEVLDNDLHNRHQLVCVYPTFADLPWYADHPTDARLRQESYLLNVVIPHIDRTYPVRPGPAGRLLVGFSKSGWGAFSLLLRHPDVFGKAAAWDAPLMQDRPNRFGMGPIFSTPENFAGYRITSLLRRHADRLQTAPPRLVHLGHGSFLQHYREAESLMDALGIQRVSRSGPRRQHAWHSGWLPEAVDLLTAADMASP